MSQVHSHIADQENLPMSGVGRKQEPELLAAAQLIVKKALGDRSNTVQQLPTKHEPTRKGVMEPPKVTASKKFQVVNKAIPVTTKATKANDKENNVTKRCGGKVVRQESIIKPIQLAPTKLNLPTNSIACSVKPTGVYDPDDDSKDDPQMVTEYIQDILTHLRDIEVKFPINEKFMDNMKITPKMRSTLVGWLVDAHRNFCLELDTLHLCISIVDRFVQANKSVDRNNYQLIGVAALMLATKYEEVLVPDISDFVYICDNAFTAKQILRMEVNIVKHLDFRMGWPLSIYFLRRYSKVARVKPDHHQLAKYILELALVEYSLAHVKPSVQAAGACCLSIAIINEVMEPLKVWTPTLMYYTKYKYADFKDVMYAFAQLVSNAGKSKFDVIREKYSSSKFNKISVNSKLEGPLIRKLTTSPVLSRK